jgi:hypothetical protein
MLYRCEMEPPEAQLGAIGVASMRTVWLVAGDKNEENRSSLLKMRGGL